MLSHSFYLFSAPLRARGNRNLSDHQGSKVNADYCKMFCMRARMRRIDCGSSLNADIVTTYVRWGRSKCPHKSGTELVYSGKAAGSKFNQPGGGANYLCMPVESPAPEYAEFQPGEQTNRAYLYGLDYVAFNGPLSGVNEKDPPCAVCMTRGKSTSLMIPGRINCPLGWTREYSGYLMSTLSFYDRTSFVCIDGEPEAYLDSVGDIFNVGLFAHVEAICGSLPCPPYEAGKEVTCVVCSY